MKEIYDCQILVVDDQPELLRLVEDILRKEGFAKVVTASGYGEALARFREKRPDAALLDVMLPDGDGFSLLRELRRDWEMPVLFLSARDQDEDRLLGLGLGADDYITKPFLPRELTLRLCAVLRRAYFPVSKKREERPDFWLGNRHVNLNRGTVVTSEGEELTLTAKEYALLEKLYENRGNIVTMDSLCEAAWGDSSFGYENTLNVHVRRLREKIEEDPSSPRWLLTARGFGYRLAKEDSK